MTVQSKPDLGNGISHPARFSKQLLPIFAEILEGHRWVVDPFAGTGRIHDLRELGDFVTTGYEIEPEWANLRPGTIVANALDLPCADETFDAVCTSPCYGNRLADSHNAKDGSVRRSYTHDLGRELTPGNSGSLQWGPAYREFHEAAWHEAARILRPGGLFVLNIKDHIRNKERQFVAGWHVTTLCRLGFDLLHHVEVGSRGLRIGENRNERVDGEQVYVFKKGVTNDRRD